MGNTMASIYVNIYEGLFLGNLVVLDQVQPLFSIQSESQFSDVSYLR